MLVPVCKVRRTIGNRFACETDARRFCVVLPFASGCHEHDRRIAASISDRAHLTKPVDVDDVYALYAQYRCNRPSVMAFFSRGSPGP